MRLSLVCVCLLAGCAAVPVARASELLTNNNGRAMEYGVTYSFQPAIEHRVPSALTDGEVRTMYYLAGALQWAPGEEPSVRFNLGKRMLVTEVDVWFGGKVSLGLETESGAVDLGDAEWHRVEYPETSWLRVKDLALLADTVTLSATNPGGRVEITEVEIWGEPADNFNMLGELLFSAWPPVAGQPVNVSVAVRNTAESALDAGTVTFRVRQGDEERELGSAQVGPVQPGREARAAVAWQPENNGRYLLTAECPGGGEVTAEVPVLQRRLYLAWYGAAHAERLKWVNVAMNTEGLAAERWIERGAIPLTWAGGYCYKEKTEDEFVQYWNDALRGSPTGLAIDEFGCDYGGEVDQKMAAALRRVKAEHPEAFLLVWNAGALQDVLMAGYRVGADLVLPETYMQYLGWDYGVFDRTAEQARGGGIADKTIFGLCTTTDKGGVTKEQLEEQFRYIRRVAPEFPGVGFFHSATLAPGMIEWADELCYRYFIAPVLWLQRQPERTWLLRNIGGMDATNVIVRWQPVGPGQGTAMFLSRVGAGSAVVLTAPAGAAEPTVEAPAGCTVLGGREGSA